MPIQILPDALVARIAAGEVVERPASVVKELVENAIDAGATDIRVECAEGGRRLIRITDNGHGIRKAEMALAFTHHATSKLQTTEDLSRIGTLGFRGEALASVASVSQVSCVSRHADEQSGTLLRLDNGRVVNEERMGRPAGTTMTIEHLFARVPARLKFLKSNQTERGHIDGVVMRYALAYPHIRFTLAHDGKLTFQTNGGGKLHDVLVEMYGAHAAAQMVPIGVRDEGKEENSVLSAHPASISVAGYVALPQLDHSNRSKITLFVNGRPVQDTRITYMVIQAYHTLLMVGRFPIAVVLVRVPAEDVDVNVHPAKAEVRFREADAVSSVVQRAVRRTLLDHMPVPEAPSVFGGTGNGTWGTMGGAADSAAARPSEVNLADITHPAPVPIETPQPTLGGSASWARVGIARQSENEFVTPPSPSAHLQSHNLPALRILGQLAQTYIIAEGPEGLYLIDQHAAHERILFEKLLAERELGAVSSQALLDPVPVDIPADSAYLLEENLPVLHDVGFEIEAFGSGRGGHTFLVRAVPTLMIQDDLVAALRQLVADLESGDAPLRKELEARVLRRVCKRMAIKAGRVLAFAEMAALVRDLEACESPRTCPHGRPTMIQIGTGQLEKEFGRLG
jgi:DNA mismatch repair protein MutL